MLRAKLLIVRALSTVFLSLALAQAAAAQYPGAPRASDQSWWLGVEGGNVRGATLSDGWSSATWQLEGYSPYRVTMDYGRRERTLGLSLSQAVVPMTFTGAACTGCAAQVTALQGLARYRLLSPFFVRGIYTATELSAGITTWNGLKGRTSSLGAMGTAPKDLTYGISLGLVMPLGERLELSGNYGTLQIRHAPKGKTGTQSVTQNTVRFGARLRLGK